MLLGIASKLPTLAQVGQATGERALCNVSIFITPSPMAMQTNPTLTLSAKGTLQAHCCCGQYG